MYVPYKLFILCICLTYFCFMCVSSGTYLQFWACIGYLTESELGKITDIYIQGVAVFRCFLSNRLPF